MSNLELARLLAEHNQNLIKWTEDVTEHYPAQEASGGTSTGTEHFTKGTDPKPTPIPIPPPINIDDLEKLLKILKEFGRRLDRLPDGSSAR
ncbi:MAG: hypothetical protein R6V75_09630 [Bacteroidales bacterium]